MLRLDGQMAIVDGDGKLRSAEASTELIAAGMTPLDAKTIDDVLAHLASGPFAEIHRLGACRTTLHLLNR